MPHEQAWIDDCVANHMADLHKDWKTAADIIETQNRAMRTTLNECPFPLRTPETCQECGNEACIQAYKEQDKIWGKDQEEPASRASIAGGHPEAEASNVQSRFRNSQESRLHGQGASGIEPDLFVLLARLREDEDMAA